MYRKGRVCAIGAILLADGCPNDVMLNDGNEYYAFTANGEADRRRHVQSAEARLALGYLTCNVPLVDVEDDPYQPTLDEYNDTWVKSKRPIVVLYDEAIAQAERSEQARAA